MMKRLLLTALAASLMTLGSTAILADPKNDNWDEDKTMQIMINRCSDAGHGNGAEGVGLPPGNDLDPGESPYAPNNGGDVASSPENTTPRHWLQVYGEFCGQIPN